MWKMLQESPPLYITFEEQNYELIVTNFISIWSINFTRTSFLSLLKECNKDLEFDSDAEFVQQGIIMLRQPDKIKKLEVKKEDGGNTLVITIDMSFEYPFQFMVKLAKGSEKFFYKKVTKQLLNIIRDLRSSQTELIAAVRDKDNVIKAYKSKGIKLNARRLKTNAFNDDAHMNGHKEYETAFGTNGVPETVLTKTELLSEEEPSGRIANVKQEPIAIESEPETTTNETAQLPNVITKIEIKQEPVEAEPPRYAVKRQRKKLNI